VGRGKALDLLLSEECISAEKALALGLVDRVVPVGDVKKAALETARLFSSKPAPTVAGVKSLLQFSIRDLEAYLELENRVLSTIVSSTDFKSRLDQCV
jgi:enoyl-CoA hydratase/carnithine racemase